MKVIKMNMNLKKIISYDKGRCGNFSEPKKFIVRNKIVRIRFEKKYFFLLELT